MSEDTCAQKMFTVFATTYPHEAYDYDPPRFITLAKRKNPGITTRQILTTLEVTKGSASR